MAEEKKPGFLKRLLHKNKDKGKHEAVPAAKSQATQSSSTSTPTASMAHHLTKVKVVRNSNYKASGIGSYVFMMQRYGKHGMKPTMPGPFQHSDQKVVRADADGTTGEVQAQDQQNDSSYLCPVQIGTPAQTLMLDFDTGSSDLWVWSTELPQATISQAGSHVIYDPAKSSTFQKTSSTWKISYGDSSSASGTVGTDDVSVGGLKITAQAIELANTISSQFAQDTADGLLGLAWGSINTVQPTPVKTPVDNMIAQKDITGDMELFTAKLGSWRDANDPDKGESFYTFGFIDQPTITASGMQPAYTPVDNSQGFWMFSSASFSINGTTTQQSGNTAIADTGTTLALVSDAMCKAIYAAIPGSSYNQQQQGYIFPTNTTADQLPVVQVAVGDTLFTINKEDLAFADAGNNMVYGGIQSRGSMTFDILGDTFLKSIYAIFDVGQQRFGAVQRTEPTQNLAAPPQ